MSYEPHCRLMGDDTLKGRCKAADSIIPNRIASRDEVYNLGNKDPVTVTYMIECLEYPVGKKNKIPTRHQGVTVGGQSCNLVSTSFLSFVSFGKNITIQVLVQKNVPNLFQKCLAPESCA